MSRKNGSTLIRILKILVLTLCGFAGGSLSPWILGWIKSVPVTAPADAYAIANTYIVFTTIIFVSITLLLAIAGYVVTQQFSAAKIAHEMQIIDELKERLATDEQLGISLVNELIENKHTSQQINQSLTQRLSELLGKRLAENRSAQARTQEEGSVLERLSENMFGKGDGK